jgi:hypothetical protein
VCLKKQDVTDVESERRAVVAAGCVCDWMPVSGLCAVSARNDTLQDNRRRSNKAEAVKVDDVGAREPARLLLSVETWKNVQWRLRDRSQVSVLAGMLQKMRCMLTPISNRAECCSCSAVRCVDGVE